MEIFGNYKIFWFCLGFILLVLEALTPGLVLVFFGLGAWVVLILIYFLPMEVGAQWLVFSLSSVVFLAVLRRHVSDFFRKNAAVKTDSLSEPMVADQYLGRKALVLEAFDTQSFGLVEFNGTNWQARSRFKLEKGVIVRLVDVDGLTLWVEPLSENPD